MHGPINPKHHTILQHHVTSAADKSRLADNTKMRI